MKKNFDMTNLLMEFDTEEMQDENTNRYVMNIVSRNIFGYNVFIDMCNRHIKEHFKNGLYGAHKFEAIEDFGNYFLEKYVSNDWVECNAEGELV